MKTVSSQLDRFKVGFYYCLLLPQCQFSSDCCFQQFVILPDKNIIIHQSNNIKQFCSTCSWLNYLSFHILQKHKMAQTTIMSMHVCWYVWSFFNHFTTLFCPGIKFKLLQATDHSCLLIPYYKWHEHGSHKAADNT